MEKVEVKESGLKAKDASLFGKIIGGIEILAGSVTLIALTCCGKVTAETAKELFTIVLGCGFSIMGIFGTVDLNIMLDKFTKKREE